MIGRIVLAAALTVGAAPLSAQDAATTLERAERAYHALTTLEAEFVQTLVNPMLGAPEQSSGILYLEPPRKFAMRFEDPAGDRIVVDGKWLWTYAPSSVADQVMKQPVPSGGASTPNLMAQFVDRPLERYRATYQGADTLGGQTVDVVRLDPKDPGTGFTEATIAVGRRDGLLWKITLREESGQRRTLVFRNIHTNAGIPPREFSFVVPKGARVVTP